MFEKALLDSSPRQISVLHRNHYLLSAFAGTLLFAQALYLLPLILAPAGQRPLIIAASMVGVVASFYALMLCYVWADARQHNLRAWPWLGVALLLNLPGFMGYLVYSARKSGDWRRAAIPLAYVVESVLVGLLIVVPLIVTQALPRLAFATPLAPLPARPPAPAPPQHARPTIHRTRVDPFTVPREIPPLIADIHELPEPPQIGGPTGTQVIGVPDGIGRGDNVLGSVPWGTQVQPPPPVSPAPAPRGVTTIRLSGPVVAAKGIFQPRPPYPRIAVISHTEGTVILQAVIGKDGTIQDLKLVSGPALLVQAALDAVRMWRYQPTLIGSEPVEVLTEIDVNFRLDE